MKIKHMIAVSAAGVLGCLMATAGESQVERSGAVPTNLPRVFAVPAPPAGFDPLLASAAQLEAQGYPPRPNPVTSPTTYALWARVMTSGAKRVVPKLEHTNIFHGPAKIGKSSAAVNGQASTASDNWSGDAVVTGNSGPLPPTFSYLIGDYVVPYVRQPLSTCSGAWDWSSEWVGIDGFDSSDVLQAGVDAAAYCAGSTTKRDYSAWYEWFPSDEVRISKSAFPVFPGNDLFIQVWSTSPTQGKVYLYNYDTNIAVSLSFSAPSGTILQGNSAEWVVERPTVGGTLATLSGYSQDFFTEASAYDSYGDVFTPGDPGTRVNYDITMVDSDGNALSVAQNVGPDPGSTNNFIWFQAVGGAE
jgi:Peptidase A4 family